MKKALALLLTLAMLATMTAVPAWAEEDVAFDIPVIEEVTEEELEEVELFSEEVTEVTEGDTNLANVKWKTYVPAEDDGVTYFTEMKEASVSLYNLVSATTQGNLASITNGIYTTGVMLEDPSANSEVDYYPVVNDAVEGFMGSYRNTVLNIDFGETKTFAGIRLVDDHKARAMKARKATRVYITISDDGNNWTTTDATDVAVARGQDYETTYSDFFFKRLNREVNLTARYVRVYVANVNNHEQFDIEEIIMLDADSSKDTYTTVTAKDYYDFDENWEIEVGSNLGGSNAGKLIDGTIFGGQGNCWHSIANASGHTYTEADRTVTITFDKPTNIGGIRIFPRTEIGGASPNYVKLLGTLDGEEWFTIWANKHLAFASSPVSMDGREAYFPFGREYPLMGLKVVAVKNIDNTSTYTNYTELQLLKPAQPTDENPDFNAIPADEVTMGLPMGVFATYGVKPGATDTAIRDTSVGYKAMDGISLSKQYFDNNGKPGGGFGTYQLHHDYCIAGEGATLTGSYKYNTVRAIYDMGKEYEFSGIRFYQRVAGNQNITVYDLSVSDDGTNWIKLDRSTLPNAIIATTSSFAFAGKTYNYKARYLKFDIAKTASGHWGLEEIRLLNPKSGVETKTPAILAAEIEATKGEINNIINTYKPYDVTLDNASVIKAAKATYDILTSDVQATIDTEKLDTLYNAAIELSHNVRVNKYGLTDPSATNHNGQKGFRNIDYTLYVNDVEGEEPVTVTGLSYDGEAISNNYDRWTSKNNGDGTVTLTLGGNYWNDPDWKNWIEGPMTASIKSYETTGYYYRTVNKIDNYSTAPVEIRPESFTGTLVREITMKDEGDHYLTVTFSDGTEKEIILSSEYVWTNVPSTAVLGERDADAIKPSTNWKFATNLYAEGTVTSRGNALFNGVYNADMYSETWTMGGSYYTEFDAEGNGTNTSGNTQLLAAPNDTVWFDFGEPLRMSGVRLHERTNNIVTAKVYGTNEIDGDATEWKLLGETKNNNAKTNTITFKKNYAYRYIKIQYALPTQVYTFLNEIAILAPKTLLSSDADVTVDVAEGDLAQFKFDQGASNSSPKKLIDEDRNAVHDYVTFDKGVLTFNNDFIKSLSDGAHKFQMTFTTGEEYIITVNKKDSSKVSYVLFSNNASGALVLESPRAKDVKSLKFADGTEISKFTLSEDKKTINVVRQFFRQSKDLFAGLDVEGTYVEELTATYEDDTTKTFYITISANWGTATEVKGTYAADEITPDITKWKARVSTAADGTQAMGILTKAAINKKDQQNWHSFFGAVDGTVYGDSNGTLGHYIDIDFGENPAPYIGFRHLQRPAGSTWTAKNLLIMGKNAAGEEWVTIYNKVPTYEQIGIYENDAGKWPIYEGEFRFEDEVNYRYVRIHVFSGAHATADTLHVLKKMASIENATVAVDKAVAEKAEFAFDLSSAAEGVITVKANGTEIAAENYTFDKATGVLAFTDAYVATLPEGETAFTVTIDGWDNTVTVTKLDKFTKTYNLTDETTGMGDYELKLYALNADTVTEVKYGTKAVEFTVENGEIVIQRHIFRKLDNFYLNGSATIKVTYENAGEVEYNITFGVAEYTINNEGGVFGSDEIVPVYGTWKAKLSSTKAAASASALFGKKASDDFNWHSAYVDKNGEAIFENFSDNHYAEIDFGEKTEFSGIRYEARKTSSGDWAEVKLMGSNDGGETWEEIIPWTATGINTDNRVSTIKFGKNVSYEKVRFYIYSGGVATGKYVTFLKPEKVVVNTSSTNGGNIMIDKDPSLGSDVFNPGDEVTYTATPEEGNEFMYWIEANTGKILGYEEGLKLQTTVGKSIQAVFAEVGGDSPYVGFFGRNGLNRLASANINKDKTLGEQGNLTIPRAEKLYQTGYTFTHWLLGANEYTAEEVANLIVTENADFIAVYVRDEETTYNLTVENGTVVDGGEKFAYNTKLTVVANEAAEGKVFNYWTVNGQIVSYAEEYTFYMPDFDVTVVAVFGDNAVEEEITMSMTYSLSTISDSNGNPVKVAGFVTSRNIPAGKTILETGIIYVKDASYGDLTISSVGDKSQSDKEVKVAIAAKNGEDENGNAIYVSGQHKLSASYNEIGIKARGFITYLEGGVVKTIYTDTQIIG